MQGPVAQQARDGELVQGLVEQPVRVGRLGRVALPAQDGELVQGPVVQPARDAELVQGPVVQLGWGVPPVPDGPPVPDEEPGQVVQLVPGVPPGWAPVWLAAQVLPVQPPDEREQLGAPPAVPAVAALLLLVAALPPGEARRPAG